MTHPNIGRPFGRNQGRMKVGRILEYLAHLMLNVYMYFKKTFKDMVTVLNGGFNFLDTHIRS